MSLTLLEAPIFLHKEHKVALFDLPLPLGYEIFLELFKVGPLGILANHCDQDLSVDALIHSCPELSP